MKKTCYNCSHFWGEIHNPEDEMDHMHDFCSLHKCFLKMFLEYGDLDGCLGDEDAMEIAKVNDIDTFIYDDLETGVASCYMFAPREEAPFPDEWYDRNKAHNDELRKALKDAGYWDYDWDDELEDEFSDEVDE